MPYLSHNYRYEPPPRHKSLVEAALFVILSTVAVFLVLFVMGWFSVFAKQTTASGVIPTNHRTIAAAQK